MEINPVTGIRNDALAAPRKTEQIQTPRFDIHAPRGMGREDGYDAEKHRAPQRGLTDEETESVQNPDNSEPDEEQPATGSHINCVA